MIDDFDLSKLIEPLQEWFLSHARVLPWREEPKGYYVWVSEIMLQQTRVEAVKPYFERFIRELPNVEALANCPEDKLLKLWEGLGYYNRVRNMKVAAEQMMKQYQGAVPSEYDQLLELKGIGHYTAGAIASIAYGRPVPAVDGNVLRVISRVTGDDSDIMKQSVRNHMEALLLDMMQRFGKKNDEKKIEDTTEKTLIPSVFNQALMELGAIVCVPNGEPHCQECPWGDFCQARLQNRISEIPVKKKQKERRIEKMTVLVVREGDKVAIHKRRASGLLAGLYELPNCKGYLTMDEVISYVKDMGYSPLRIRPLEEAKHIFSHVEWHMKGYVVFVEEAIENQPWIFVEAEDARERYAIPTAFSKYAEYVNIR